MLRPLSLAVLLLFSGCGMVRINRRALSPAARASLRSPRTVVVLPQTVIGTSITECPRADVPSVPYVGNGLIGLLATTMVTGAFAAGAEVAARNCETSQAQKAEQAAWPVRDALLGHDSEAVLRDALTRALGPLTWLGTSAVQLEHVQASATDRDLLHRFLAGSAERPVLLVRVDQWLTPGFDELVVSAEAWMLTGQMREVLTDGRTQLEPVAAYHNLLVASVRLESQPEWGKTAQESFIQLWSREGTARRVLDTALDEVMQLVAYDLATAGPADHADYRAPRGAARSAVTALPSWDDRGFALYPLSMRQAQINGFIERETLVRKWVRLPTGELFSIGAAVEVAPPPL